MRVANVDGLVTLFYDGSKPLYNHELDQKRIRDNVPWRDNVEEMNISDESKNYFRERMLWQQIIIVDGVTEIPEWTFKFCKNIKRVIFAETVIRIERGAFFQCTSLIFIKWSITIEYIGRDSFKFCNLSSVFIPLRCREVGESAFNKKQHTFDNLSCCTGY